MKKVSGKKFNACTPECIQKLTSDVTFLLKELANKEFAFKIDRSPDECRTPRRNPDVEKAQEFFQTHGHFCTWIRGALLKEDTKWQQLINSSLQESSQQPRVTLASNTRVDGIFMPIVPIFMEGGKTNDSDSGPQSSKIARLTLEDSNMTISLQDTSIFLDKQIATLQSNLEQLDKDYSNQVWPLSNLIFFKFF